MLSRLFQTVALAAAVSVVGAAAVRAQDRAFLISARAGGLSAMRDLNTAGTQDFEPGFVLGGSVAVQMTHYLSIEADMIGVQSHLRTDGVETGVQYTRYFYGAAVRAQYPTGIGVTPYALAGGGAEIVNTEHRRGQLQHGSITGAATAVAAARRSQVGSSIRVDAACAFAVGLPVRPRTRPDESDYQ